MQRRSSLILGFILLGVLGMGMALFYPQSDEEKIAEQLHGLAQAIGFSEPIANPVFFGSALAEHLEPYMTESVQVMVPEVQQHLPRERARLALAAALALSRYGSLDVSLSDLAIVLLPEGANVTAQARVTATSGSEPKMDRRPVHFALVRESGTFKVSSVRVEPPQ